MIKPLVWKENRRGFLAETPWGNYRVEVHSSTGMFKLLQLPRTNIITFGSAEEAKSAAEAHHEACIRSCLDAQDDDIGNIEHAKYDRAPHPEWEPDR